MLLSTAYKSRSPSRRVRPIAVAALAVAVLVPTGGASAASIVGSSDLLSAADANQLEAWLGQGPIVLTNVFDKGPGNDTAAAFHAAADGKGATFSIFEFVGPDGGAPWDKPVIVGGYNPQSWTDPGVYNYTPDDADRTAFLFNLTQGLKFDQQKGTSNGQFQTYNASGYGPTFGGGHDLNVADYHTTGLDTGYSYLFSYGDPSDVANSIVTYPGAYSGYLAVGQLEVFTISTPVPEPATWALSLLGLIAVGAAARGKRRTV